MQMEVSVVVRGDFRELSQLRLELARICDEYEVEYFNCKCSGEEKDD